MEPASLQVRVSGGALHVARWGPGPASVIGIHGITASSMSLLPVARRLGPDVTLVAPDLRGRGASNGLPGPFGLGAHAEDCARVLEELAGAPAVVVGESMGAFVAVVLAAARPDLVERLVLVDGGLPLPLPEGVDPAGVAEAVLGPALARLRMTFPTAGAYLDFWRAHPAVGEEWSADLEAYLRYDLVPAEDGAFRSRVSEDAVRADSDQVLLDTGTVDQALRSLTCPIRLIRATRNLLNQVPPLIPDEVVAEWRSVLPRLDDTVVDDTNHYTVMLGARGADTIVDAVVTAPDAATSHPPSRGATSEK